MACNCRALGGEYHEQHYQCRWQILPVPLGRKTITGIYVRAMGQRAGQRKTDTQGNCFRDDLTGGEYHENAANQMEQRSPPHMGNHSVRRGIRGLRTQVATVKRELPLPRLPLCLLQRNGTKIAVNPQGGNTYEHITSEYNAHSRRAHYRRGTTYAMRSKSVYGAGSVCL